MKKWVKKKRKIVGSFTTERMVGLWTLYLYFPYKKKTHTKFHKKKKAGKKLNYINFLCNFPPHGKLFRKFSGFSIQRIKSYFSELLDFFCEYFFSFFLFQIEDCSLFFYGTFAFLRKIKLLDSGIFFYNFFVIFYQITKRHLSVKFGIKLMDGDGDASYFLFGHDGDDPKCIFNDTKNLWWRRLVLKNITTS